MGINKIKYSKRLCIALLVPLGVSLQAQDSLQGKTLLQLDTLAVDAMKKGDITKSRIYAHYQINKAKKLKDSMEVAMACYTFMLSENNQECLAYCDTAIAYTRNIKSRDFPTYPLLAKGKRLYKMGEIDGVIDCYIEAYKYAKAKNNIKHIYSVKQAMANIKAKMGRYSEAIELYKEHEHYAKSKPTSKRFRSLHYSNLINISRNFIRERKLDSASKYINRALKETLKDNQMDYFNKAVIVHAELDYHSGNYDSAHDSIVKYLSKNEGIVLANDYYYLASIYRKKGEHSKALASFEKVDSITSIHNKLYPYMKEVFQILSKYAESNGDKTKQLHYINKFFEIDSIYNHYTISVNPLITMEYDKPEMLIQKKRLENQNSQKTIWILVSSLLALLFSIFAVVRIKKERALKKHLAVLIKKGVDSSFVPKSSLSKNTSINVPLDIQEQIKKALLEFEDSKDIYNQDLTLAKLAKSIGTNSSYLSSYINFSRGINFPSYLKELRIKKCIEYLKTDSKLLKYSVKGIALEFGFSTSEAFSRAFVKVTNIKPSIFIKELSKKSF